MPSGDRQAAKAAAAAALRRADAAASRALAEAGYRYAQGDREKIRSGGESLAGASCADKRSASLPWDSQSRRGRVAVFLRASSELSVVSGELGKLQGHEEHLARLDRQLVEVEKTRALIASVCDEGRTDFPSKATQAGVSTGGRGKRTPSPLPLRDFGRQCAPLVRGGAGPKSPPLPMLPHRTSSSSSSAAVAGRKHVSKSASMPWGIVELRPQACPLAAVDDDCSCCLCPLGEGSLVLAFPCAANHLFHAACLQRWLKSAGAHTTCPMCRGWPRAAPGQTTTKRSD